MKRRDFFKVVTGFVAGACAAFVPKAKANLNNLKLLPSSVRKRSGREEIVDEFLLSSEKENYLVINSNGITRVIYLDGNSLEHFCDHTKEHCEQHKGNDGCSILRR